MSHLLDASVPVDKTFRPKRIYLLVLGFLFLVSGGITVAVLVGREHSQRDRSPANNDPNQNSEGLTHSSPPGSVGTDDVAPSGLTPPTAGAPPPTNAEVAVDGSIPSCASFLDGFDRMGSDLNNGTDPAEETASAELCFNKCMAVPLCSFFVYRQDGQCWLKGADAANTAISAAAGNLLYDVRPCKSPAPSSSAPTPSQPSTFTPAPPLTQPPGAYIPGANYVPMMDPLAEIGAPDSPKCGLTLYLSACGKPCTSDADCDTAKGEACQVGDGVTVVPPCVTDCRDETGTNFYLLDSEVGPPDTSNVPPDTPLLYPSRPAGKVDSCYSDDPAWTHTQWTFRLLLQLAPGKCQICSDAICEIYWPNKDGFYLTDCTGRFTSTTGEIQLLMDTAGDESATKTGPDPFTHYHYQCCCGEDNCVFNKVYTDPAALSGTRVGKQPQPVTQDHVTTTQVDVSGVIQAKYDLIMQLSNPNDLSGYTRFTREHMFYMNPKYFDFGPQSR